MKTASLSICTVLISVFASPSQSAEPGKWVNLFNSENFNNWVQHNGFATYRIENGTIVGRTAEGSPNSFLCTKQNYGDFELEFEVRVDDQLNSGVQVRSKQKPADDGRRHKAGRVYGPQVEIEASRATGGSAGYVYGEAITDADNGQGLGWISPENRRIPHRHMNDGQWNCFRVVAEGLRIRTWVNGQPVADVASRKVYTSHSKGFIGLQVHSIAADAGPYEVAWRNVRIRELQ